jgi:hypothetical protein
LILNKVIAYIDGFNLYFGIKSKNWQKYYWLDIHSMILSMLRNYQELVCVKYFTSRVTDNPDKQQRQNDYLEALETNPNIKIYFGKYQLNERICIKCGFKNVVPNEKMTDVNIATELLSDSFDNLFDTALLISADSDLVGPINRVLTLFPLKKVIIYFPPKRHSIDLSRIASKVLHVSRDILLKNQLPDTIKKLDGYSLSRPSRWR